MKKISSLSLVFWILSLVFNANAQTSGTTTGTALPSPSTAGMPGAGSISESTLQSMGFSQEEIDAVM
ncbi:MAG: hypothetical protein H7Y00_14770, partial [Fimbriimonadaceae bacterium]|nr:hypothetical protein [Chitinophagales bacterium]